MLGRVCPHPNIVTLHEADLDAEPPYLVFEYIPAGSFVTIAGTCSLKASVCRFATSSVPAAISASGGKGR
jgi:hypothetical protein